VQVKCVINCLPDTTVAQRIGHGYDIHRIDTLEVAGQPLCISGVKFDGTDAPAYEMGCVAHSDGDVVYHSVVDAILGALSMPDIGQVIFHFSSSTNVELFF